MSSLISYHTFLHNTIPTPLRIPRIDYIKGKSWFDAGTMKSEYQTGYQQPSLKKHWVCDKCNEDKYMDNHCRVSINDYNTRDYFDCILCDDCFPLITHKENYAKILKLKR